jgi:tetratricopeptide (TPR) repeat protein
MPPADEVGGAGWQISPETRRALRLQAARTAVRRRDFRRAVIEAEELLDEVPDDVDALATLAESAMELRDFEVAREAWRALVETGPQPASVLTQLGLCAFESASFDEAAQAARRALAVSDDAPEAWYLLGLCTERLEDDERAYACFERAHRGSPLGFPLPLPLDEADVRDLVQEAMAELPLELARFWAPVPVEIERLPTRDELLRSVPPTSPRVLALYTGHPPTRPSGLERPTSIRVYRTNLVHHESREHALDALLDTLDHEAADWLPDER